MTEVNEEAFRKLNELLTPDAVDVVVSKMGGYIADRNARPGRTTELPFPQPMIELAFFKAIRSCTDPERLGSLKAIYITLDKYMLTDDDCAILTVFWDLIDPITPHQLDSTESIKAFAEKIANPEMQKAVEVNRRLTEAAHRRYELLNKFTGKTE
jgi:hypothetical protein